MPARSIAQHPALPVTLFAAVIAAFVAVSVQERRLLDPADADADRLAREAVPAIEALTTIRADAHVVAVAAAQPRAAAEIVRVEEAEQSLDHAFDAYLSVATDPLDAEHREQLRRAHFELASRVVAWHGEGVEGARAEAGRALVAGAERLSELAGQQRAARIEQCAQLAKRISATHRRVESVGFLLEVTCIALAACAGAIAYRLRMRNDALVRARVEAAEARAHELELFASRVAHDIGSPLQAAKLGLDLLRRKPREADVTELTLERAARSVERVRAITEDLLDFARSGAKPAPGAESELLAVVWGVVAEVEASAAEAGVELFVEPFEPCTVAFAPGALAAVISNLLRNAVKHMDAVGERSVHVRTLRGSQSVRLEVADTGPGIPKAMATTLFDLYARGADSPGGLGIGLSTAKRLVDAHHGRIGFRAQLPRGTVFWVDLPLAHAPEQVVSARAVTQH